MSFVKFCSFERVIVTNRRLMDRLAERICQIYTLPNFAAWGTSLEGKIIDLKPMLIMVFLYLMVSYQSNYIWNSCTINRLLALSRLQVYAIVQVWHMLESLHPHKYITKTSSKNQHSCHIAYKMPAVLTSRQTILQWTQCGEVL